MPRNRLWRRHLRSDSKITGFKHGKRCRVHLNRRRTFLVEPNFRRGLSLDLGGLPKNRLFERKVHHERMVFGAQNGHFLQWIALLFHNSIRLRPHDSCRVQLRTLLCFGEYLEPRFGRYDLHTRQFVLHRWEQLENLDPSGRDDQPVRRRIFQ